MARTICHAGTAWACVNNLLTIALWRYSRGVPMERLPSPPRHAFPRAVVASLRAYVDESLHGMEETLHRRSVRRCPCSAGALNGEGHAVQLPAHCALCPAATPPSGSRETTVIGTAHRTLPPRSDFVGSAFAGTLSRRLVGKPGECAAGRGRSAGLRRRPARATGTAQWSDRTSQLRSATTPTRSHTCGT